MKRILIIFLAAVLLWLCSCSNGMLSEDLKDVVDFDNAVVGHDDDDFLMNQSKIRSGVWMSYLDLTAPERAEAFFAAAFAALRPGGALIFDVSTPEKLAGTLGHHTLTCAEDEIAYIWQNAYHEKSACVDMTLSIFEKRPDGAYDRLEERQTQRAHSRAELRSWLEQAGFERVRFFGRMRMTPPRAGDDRWHVAAKKPV